MAIKLYNSKYIARCESLRATATGDTPDETLQNLREAIDEMIKKSGREVVFEDVSPEADVQVLEVSL